MMPGDLPEDAAVLSQAEVRLRVLTAARMLDEYALPPETRQILSYALAVLLYLSANMPTALVEIVDALNESILAGRASKKDA